MNRLYRRVVKKDKRMDPKQTKLRKQAKAVVGRAAAEFVEDDMVIGLGTGSTAEALIDALIQRCRSGLRMVAVATSKASERQAAEGGIRVIDINDAPEIDLCIDGADEIDGTKRMIKGGGGALLREKIVATASREMVVIVDESKCVNQLGAFPLPVEIIRYGARATLRHLETCGFAPKLRETAPGNPFITDNDNYIVDITFLELLNDPEVVDNAIQKVVGVVETGFFFGIAGRVLIGHYDGTVKFQ
ncbi:Ribose-5-phosphate isomerase A [Chlamydiales bacterium SCGC AG-110-P3]|nr:Ribose-5-phosphate isomerase A [Chlamydiales bacterium SCGC AG-110-P3]